MGNWLESASSSVQNDRPRTRAPAQMGEEAGPAPSRPRFLSGYKFVPFPPEHQLCFGGLEMEQHMPP